MTVQEGRRFQETKAKILSGTVGSFLTAFAVHPLEVVKVRTQAQKRSPSSVVRGSCDCVILNNGLGDCLLPKNSMGRFYHTCQQAGILPRGAANTTQRGTFGTLRHILFKEGAGSLYAGLGPTLTMGVSHSLFWYETGVTNQHSLISCSTSGPKHDNILFDLR